MLPDVSPSEFMLRVLSDPAAADAAADQWAAAHPAAAPSSQGLKDLEGGSDGDEAAAAGDAAPALVRRMSLLRPRRPVLQHSLSVVGLLQDEHKGDSALALLAVQVSAPMPPRDLWRDLPCGIVRLQVSSTLTQTHSYWPGPHTCQAWHLTARKLRWMLRQRGATLTVLITSVIAGGTLGAFDGLGWLAGAGRRDMHTRCLPAACPPTPTLSG